MTEISKEVENNTISRLNMYGNQYVSRRNGAVRGSYGGVGSCGRFWILTVCVYYLYIRLCWNQNEKGNSHYTTMWCERPDVFNFVVGKEWPMLLKLQFLTFYLVWCQPYETMTVWQVLRVTYLVSSVTCQNVWVTYLLSSVTWSKCHEFWVTVSYLVVGHV